MVRWIDESFARLISMAKVRHRSSLTVGRLYGPDEPNRAKVRLLVIADAAGATLQINLLRPLQAAIAAGDLRMVVLTEQDELSALKSGAGAKKMLADAWQQAAPHLVFVSRYGGSLAETLLRKCADQRVPLIYHIDDNLFEVPVEAGVEKARKYGDPARQNSIRMLLSGADAAYLSTSRLAEQMQAHSKLSPLLFVGEIASASDPISSFSSNAAASDVPRFGYMASSSHAADLKLALPGIIAALDGDPDLHFTVFGSLQLPPELSVFGQRVSHVSALGDYDGFLRQLTAMRWDWGLAPLRPGRFNEAKTDTKWVEYSAAGIPTIVSDHLVYQDCSQKGAAVKVGDGEWKEALPRILADRTLAQQTLANARERLISHHSLINMAAQLERVFLLAGLDAARAAVIHRGRDRPQGDLQLGTQAE